MSKVLTPAEVDFSSAQVHMGYLVDKVALGKVFLRCLLFHHGVMLILEIAKDPS